jgi:hypothetical protein
MALYAQVVFSVKPAAKLDACYKEYPAAVAIELGVEWARLYAIRL